jgi:hypothetical protein
MADNFDALIAELNAQDETMAKSMAPAGKDKDDKEIQQAAEEGQDQSDKDAGNQDKDDDDDEEVFGKSFEVTLDSGEKVEVLNGTEMMKSLHAGLQAARDRNSALSSALESAMILVKNQGAAIIQQAEMLKSLQADVKRLGGQGTGRKALLNIHEKPAIGPEPKPAAATPDQVMTKAMAAFTAGKITGLEVSRLEGDLGSGRMPPAELLARIA